MKYESDILTMLSLKLLPTKVKVKDQKSKAKSEEKERRSYHKTSLHVLHYSIMADTTNNNNSDSDDERRSDIIDSPPRPVRTTSSSSSSPQNLSPTSTNRSSSSPTRIMTSPTSRYGAIRPPISILQDEFCTTYRLWEEHDAVLRRVEQNKQAIMNENWNDWRKYKPKQQQQQQQQGHQKQTTDVHHSDSSSSSEHNNDNNYAEEEWEEAFAHLRTLYSRHQQYYDDYHHHQEDYQQRNNYSSTNNTNDFLESLFAIDDASTLDEEKLEEDMEDEEDDEEDEQQQQQESVDDEVVKVKTSEASTADDFGCDDSENVQGCSPLQTYTAGEGIHHQHQPQRRKRDTNIENLAKLLFRPGSKLSGIMETPSSTTTAATSKRSIGTTTQCEYNLVIMEENNCDELGRPKGYLARHKSGGDEQCVFVHVKFIPVNNAKEVNEEEKQEDGTDDAIATLKPPPQSQSPLELEDRLTIQIEYVDGDKQCRGVWNANTLSFEGTVQKLGEGNSNQFAVDRGGGLGRMRRSVSSNSIRRSPSSNSIMNGLVNGRSVGNSQHGNPDEEDNVDPPPRESVIMSVSSSTTPTRNHSTFSLSPCTHVHPHGFVTTPLWKLLHMPQLENMMGDENISMIQGVGLLSGGRKKNNVSEEDQIILMDELASDDNRKFALHRARTERLLVDTLVKLVELGQLIDFAELARKRNAAKRREKWRVRMRKITPRVPSKLKRRKNKDGGENDQIDIANSVHKKKIQFYDHLAALSWGSLLEAASVHAERTCATFRRRSALLDGLEFQSDEYKYQVMSDLRANGLTLASSHSEWDQCIQMGRTVALGWSWFERGSWSCFERSAVVGKHCVYLLFQMHSRLGISHELLEKSFRSADARISVARLDSLKQVRCGNKSKDDSEEILCGVCQCDVYEAEEDEEGENKSIAVTLPCSHSFHWHCIREWLHDHSKCPICRVELNASSH